MELRTLTLFGHRELKTSDKFKQDLKYFYSKHIQKNNIEYVLFGGHGDFDYISHQVISELKKERFPNLKRIYSLEDEKFLNPYKRPKYLKSEDYEEFVFYPRDFNYWYQRLYYRNIEMIKASDYVVFYVEHKSGGAYKALQFAKKIKKPHINLFDDL